MKENLKIFKIISTQYRVQLFFRRVVPKIDLKSGLLGLISARSGLISALSSIKSSHLDLKSAFPELDFSFSGLELVPKSTVSGFTSPQFELPISHDKIALLGFMGHWPL